LAKFPIFLSIVIVVRDQSVKLASILDSVGENVASMVQDYELIVVDNGSSDESVQTLKSLTGAVGLPNLQAYVLTKSVDLDTASWVGLENALGDFIAVFDPELDDIEMLRTMIDAAVSGADVVFACNDRVTTQGIIHGLALRLFNALYARLQKVNLSREAPRYRIVSKRVINFILQHPRPSQTYRYLPATAGFSKVSLRYNSKPMSTKRVSLREDLDRAMLLLMSTSRAPMRLVNILALLGAVSSLCYSIYVISVAIWQRDVEPGWATLSLQQSGMFFLISLVLLILGEYIVQLASLGNEGPRYHVAQEFTSTVITRRQKLNVDSVDQQVKQTGAESSSSEHQ
jgi:glycosyltransferase involved in cell wall biosynthesis